MYSVCVKLLSGIRSMYVDSSAYVRVKEGESALFRIGSGMRQGCVISPWIFNGRIDERGETRYGKEGNEISIGRERVQITWPLACK